MRIATVLTLVCAFLLVGESIAASSWFSWLFSSETSTSKKSPLKGKVVPRKRLNTTAKSIPPRKFNASVTPAKHSFDAYLGRKMVDTTKRLGSMASLIFVGDSLFYKLSKNATYWNNYEKNYAAINLGSPADRTEHLLYRFRNGTILKNITSNSPLVVIGIGSANINIGDTPEAVTNGVTNVLNVFRQYLKSPKFVLLSLIPRAVNETNRRTAAVNQMFEAMSKDSQNKDITFLDIAPLYLTPNKTLNSKLFATHDHPNTAGHEIVMKALQPAISKLPILKNVPVITPKSVLNASKVPVNSTRSTTRPVVKKNTTAKGVPAKGAPSKAAPTKKGNSTSKAGAGGVKPPRRGGGRFRGAASEGAADTPLPRGPGKRSAGVAAA